MSEYKDIELTQKERDILVLVCRGLSNPKIAQHLSVSVSTVNNSLHRILNKFGTTNRGQAVIMSLKLGLIDPLDIYSVEEWVDVLMPPIPEKQILTQRERQMLVLYAWGLNNQQVADKLLISLSAVKACVGNLYKKIGAANRIDAIMIGLKHGYLSAWDFLSPEDNADLAVAAGPQVMERLIASLRAKVNSFDSDDLLFRPYMQSFNTYLQKLIHLRQAKNGTYTP